MIPEDMKHRGGLYTGFEFHRALTSDDEVRALNQGMISLDANVLLNLYRYNAKTVDDLLSVMTVVQDRLFIPHQVVREFWRSRQSVISSLGSTSKDAKAAMTKNGSSTKDAIARWAKSIALPEDRRQPLLEHVDVFFEALIESVEKEDLTVSPRTSPSDEDLLRRLEHLLEGSVGEPLSDQAWKHAVDEGERRVAESIPPGYMDVEKLESELPEGAAGDYLVWHQLLIEAKERAVDLVLVTADTKEDWWNRDRGALLGARHELIDEYLQACGHRFILLQPTDLIMHSMALGVGTSGESVEDIERVRDEKPQWAPWTADAARAVLRELDSQGHSQAQVIREAISTGGRISRARVYSLDKRDQSQMLRGFTRPVKRVTQELQAQGVVPFGVSSLLDAVYETGVKTSHFEVPIEVVELLSERFAVVPSHTPVDL